MTTLDEVITIQKQSNIIFPPVIKTVEATVATLSIGLVNQSTSSTVYAYITGLSINNNYAVMLIEADGETIYYPSNPTATGTALSANCSIPLGAPGTTTNVTIPYIAGGRIWFSFGSPLTFFLNPGNTGPGLVEPSVSNTSDPNYNISWDFCEFTYNSSQLFANISYVDFVCLPIALTLNSTSGAVTHVSGLPSNGLATICNNLKAQDAVDGAGWSDLIITNNGSNLRALNPTQGIVFNSALFENYWTAYVNSIWSYYISNTLTIDTQASWGLATGQTSNDRTSLSFSGIGSFTKPTAADIFGGSSGAFAAQATNTDELLNIGARLDASFNRSTLLIDKDQPDDELVSTYYTNSVTNHYARIVHAANVDGLGYCFPYDDVTPNGGVNQCGEVNDPTPASFIVTVGGANAYAQSAVRARNTSSVPQKPTSHVKRSLLPDIQDIKPKPEYTPETQDLESGKPAKLLNEYALPMNPQPKERRLLKLPPVINRFFEKYLVVRHRNPPAPTPSPNLPSTSP